MRKLKKYKQKSHTAVTLFCGGIWIIFLFALIKTDKDKSTEKIDGAVATIMALDRAIRCGNDGGASVYDDRGLLFI